MDFSSDYNSCDYRDWVRSNKNTKDTGKVVRTKKGLKMQAIKRYLERQTLSYMVKTGYLDLDPEPWFWDCLFEYFTHE